MTACPTRSHALAMDDGGLFLGFFVAPLAWGFLAGLVIVLPVVLVAFHLGFTKLVGVTIDGIRAAIRLTRERRRSRALSGGSSPPY